MKLKDLTFSEEEIVQSLLDVGFALNDDIEVSDRPTLKEQMDSIENRIRMIDDLFDIATEIDARETGCNCVIEKLQGVGWNDLCDKGIEILEKLKVNK